MLQYLLIFCCVFFLAHAGASAQKQANIWYFGNGAGIDFNDATPLTLTNSVMSTPEGCATIADSAGNLLFYTNGFTIWNRNHEPMVNGTNLTGHESATQSAVIVPDPGSSTRYYVFTNTIPASNTGLRYSIVDISLGNGMGEVVTRNIPVINSLTEKLAAVRHQNRRDVWIVVHGWNSASFYSFLLTPSGLATSPVVSTTGSRHEGMANFINAIGEMKISPHGRKLATAIFNQGFEVFDFSTATGQVSNPISLFFPNFAGCYGTAFSQDGTKLYGTVRTPSQIYQFDLNQPASMVASTAVAIREIDTESPAGALCLAPDGTIYHARDNDSYIGIITSPNKLGKAAAYVEKGLSLAGKRSRMGLPNFMSDYLYPAFMPINTCQNDTTRFVINDRGDIDSVQWDFGDSKDNFSTSFTPFHIYESPGSYTVILTTMRDGVVVEVSEREVLILPLPPTGISKKMVICRDDLILDASSPVYTDYTWSTGEKLPSIRITQPGLYWVEVFNQNCSRIDTVEVTSSTFALAIGEDVTLCKGDSTTLFATGAETYQWQPSTGLSDPTSSAPTASPAATTTYTVTGTGSDDCVQEKYITVTVVPPLIVDLGPDTTLCIGQDYMLDAGSGARSYLWSTGEESQTINVSASGIYYVRISNGSCERTDSVTVSFIPTAITVGSDTLICEGESVRLSATGMSSYRWFPQEGIDDPFSATPVARPTATTTYRVTGTNSMGCTGEAAITVQVTPSTRVHIALPNVTATVGTKDVRLPITISATAAALPVYIPACTIRVRIDAMSFSPTGCSVGKISTTTTGQETLVTIELPAITATQAEQICTEIIGTALIGQRAQTELAFASVDSDGCLYAEQQAGLLSLQGCDIGNRTVTFGSSTALTVSPNPVSGDGIVTIDTIEDGEYTLTAYTIHGQKVWQDTFVVSTTGSIIRQLPSDLFAPGLYHLMLTTPSALRTILFSISR